MKIINPSNGEILAEVTTDTIESIEQKYLLAVDAQAAWAEQSIADRIDCIKRFYTLLEAEKDTLAHTLTAEVGKPLQQSYNEINGARSRIEYFMDHSAAYLSDEWVTEHGLMKERISYEPLGVIANISAWNYPYLVGVNVFIPALLGGNAVLYKPSEYATLTGQHIGRLFQQAGLPPYVFQVITGTGETGAALLDLPLNGYFFTGSYATGKYIAQAVAGKLVPVQLELGGKDPLYVMDDVADIDAVAEAVLEGVMYNAGQSCCAVERVYVHKGVYDAFIKAMVYKAALMKVDDPLLPETAMGPICRPQQLEVLQEQIMDALDKGAQMVYQTFEMPKKGNYFPITLLTQTDHSMRIMYEESFGPVVGIQKVSDDEEAVGLMLNTEYGLTASVYGTDDSRAEKILRKMRTGTVYFNCCDLVSAALPWSGRGHSGLGSTLSYQGIRAFVQPKGWHIR